MNLRVERARHLHDAVSGLLDVMAGSRMRDLENTRDLRRGLRELVMAERNAFKSDLEQRISATERDIKRLRKEIEANRASTAREINRLVVANNGFKRGIRENRAVLDSVEEGLAPITSGLEDELISATNWLTKFRDTAARAKEFCGAMREDLDATRTLIEMLTISNDLEVGGAKHAMMFCSPQQFDPEISAARSEAEEKMTELRNAAAATRRSNKELKRALEEMIEFVNPRMYPKSLGQHVVMKDVVNRRLRHIKKEEAKRNYRYSNMPRKMIIEMMKKEMLTAVKERESILARQIEAQMKRLKDLQTSIANMKRRPASQTEAIQSPAPGTPAADLTLKDTWWKEYRKGIDENLQAIAFVQEQFTRRQSI